MRRSRPWRSADSGAGESRAAEKLLDRTFAQVRVRSTRYPRVQPGALRRQSHPEAVDILDLNLDDPRTRPRIAHVPRGSTFAAKRRRIVPEAGAP
jgi:hypothetical protein